MGTGKQERSRQTFERILNATEVLLKRQLFDDLNVAQIVKEAKSTVGSFYNLFDDKDALLPHLYAKHCENLLQRFEDFRQRVQDSNWRLAGTIRQLVEEILDVHRSEPGLLRALVLRGHCTQSARPDRSTEMDLILPNIADIVAFYRDEITHPRPKLAARIGLMAVVACIREVFLYPQTSAYSLDIKDTELPLELTRMWIGYLQTNG